MVFLALTAERLANAIALSTSPLESARYFNRYTS